MRGLRSDGEPAEIQPEYRTFQNKTLRLQSGGRIVVGGLADTGDSHDFVAVRLCL
jgi:hypothetical protein